uniref:Lytic transglycosylase domain-containing protein n=1 Tax=Ignavibacterium album TaxID=591197 RepID=A0A832G871_9BACT
MKSSGRTGMKPFYYLLTGITLTTIVFFLFFGFQFNEQKDEKLINSLIATQPEIPSEVYLFGEKVPLENFEVYERLDRELVVNTYWHSSTILALKRAARWFPIIEPILKQNDVPVDFKYLAVAESNLENVVSPAGATGFWQFIKSAATEYGLEVNDEVDERYHVEKSTEAACKFLKDAYSRFGSWTMAAAAYNAGMNGISKWSSIQKTNNYYNLTLGIETSRYIARVAAIKIIMENPKKYGYYLNENDFYKPLKFTEVKFDSSVTDFADYAASLGINYKTLKLFNPWLRDSSLKNKNRKEYSIKIPEQGSIVLIKE